jgi:hypothetical protein
VHLKTIFALAVATTIGGGAAELRASVAEEPPACTAYVVGTCAEYDITATCISWGCSTSGGSWKDTHNNTLCLITCGSE